MGALIDWDVAARAAKRFSPPPPTATRAEADEAVGELYQATARAAGHVAELTGLDEPPVTAVTRVIDRPAWIDANTSGMRAVLTPLVDKLAADNPVGRIAEGIGGRLTGVQVGLVLGFLSGKVLGQFEFFDRPAASCCWSRRTSSRSSGSSRSTRPTSGCGSACTRSPTGCSSPPSRGCASTCTTRSTRSPTPPTPTRPR